MTKGLSMNESISKRFAAAADDAGSALGSSFSDLERIVRSRKRARALVVTISVAVAVASVVFVPVVANRGGPEGGQSVMVRPTDGAPGPSPRVLNGSKQPPAGSDVQEMVGAVSDRIAGEYPDQYFASELDPAGPRFYFKGTAPLAAVDFLESLDYRTVVMEQVGISLVEVDAASQKFSDHAGLSGKCQVEPPSVTALVWQVHCKTQESLTDARSVADNYLPAMPIRFDTDFVVVDL